MDLGFCKEGIQNAFFPKSKIHDSRFKIPKRILESKGVGFKIQDSILRKKLLESKGVGFKIRDSRFTAQKKLLESKEVGFKIQDSKRILESKGVGFKAQTRRRMARERRGAESSVVSMETLCYKTIY